jgi:iron complex outermembrane recepter protein
MAEWGKQPLVTVGCGLLIAGAIVQSALAQQSRSDSAQLEEVIVTAEKRESTVQTTPISLTAVTGRTFRTEGLRT